MASIITKIRRGNRKEFKDWDFCGWDENEEGIFWYTIRSKILIEGGTDASLRGFVGFRYTERSKEKTIQLLDFDNTKVRYEFLFNDMEISQREEDIYITFTEKGTTEPTSIILSEPKEYTNHI